MSLFKLQRPLVFVDVETTGTLPTDRVVELGCVKLHPDETRTRWRSLFDPGFPIPQEATAVHGIDDERVKDAPRFVDLAPMLAKSFASCDIGGYNVEFDLKMLRAEFKRAGFDDPFRHALVVDPMVIYHKKAPRDLSMAVSVYCGATMENAHTALADAEAALDVLIGEYTVHKDLPTDIQGLAELTKRPVPANSMDQEGKIILRNGKPTFTFGKHAGKPLDSVEKSYFRWLNDQDFSDEVKMIIRPYL